MNWMIHLIWFVATIIMSFVVYKIGARKARKEVVYTFNEILKRIYQLVWSGRNDELISFMTEVCGEPPPDVLKKLGSQQHSKAGEGYIL